MSDVTTDPNPSQDPNDYLATPANWQTVIGWLIVYAIIAYILLKVYKTSYK